MRIVLLFAMIIWETEIVKLEFSRYVIRIRNQGNTTKDSEKEIDSPFTTARPMNSKTS